MYSQDWERVISDALRTFVSALFALFMFNWVLSQKCFLFSSNSLGDRLLFMEGGEGKYMGGGGEGYFRVGRGAYFFY